MTVIQMKITLELVIKCYIISNNYHVVVGFAF